MGTSDAPRRRRSRKRGLPPAYTRHYHDEPEIYFILAGSAIVYKGDSEIRVDPGSALYLGSREVHGLDSIGAAPLKLFWAYGCETAGHVINWTPVEAIYEPPTTSPC